MGEYERGGKEGGDKGDDVIVRKSLESLLVFILVRSRSIRKIAINFGTVEQGNMHIPYLISCKVNKVLRSDIEIRGS